MPGRTLTGTAASPPRRWRAGYLLAALMLLAIGIAIGSRIASRPAPSPPPARAQASGRPAHTPPAARAQQRPSSTAPSETRAGAVAAAARSITAFDGEVLLEPVRLRTVVDRIAARGTRAGLMAAFAQASARTRAKLGIDTVPRPVVILRSVPVGYRVVAFSPRQARVAVWYVGIVGSGATVEPQQSWRTQIVSLVWENGAWKVSSFQSSPGPTPPLATTAAAAAPGALFAAIPRFQEFTHAQP